MIAARNDAEAPPASPLAKPMPDGRAAILGILGTTFFARGLLVPWLGFYWDDLPTLWAIHSYGAGVTWRFFQSDRPFLPWLYQLTARLAGESPLAWQLLGLLAWFIAGVSVWWLMTRLWETRRWLALMTSLLFVVYPGFLQGPISLIYCHFLLLAALFFFSLGSTVVGVRGGTRNKAWFAAALGAQALALLSFEYLVGLELLRPVIIALVLRQDGMRGRGWVGRTARVWAPHLAVLSVTLVWRAVTPRFPTYEPALLTLLAASPAAALQVLATRISGDILRATGGAWLEAASPPALSTIGRTGILAISVAFVGAALISLWALLRSRPKAGIQQTPQTRRELALAAAVGGWGLLIAGIPVWVPLLPLQIAYPWDRMTLPFIFGASLLLAAVLIAAFGRWRASAAILAAVVALGAAHQTANAVSYLWAWRDLKGFLSQLTARVPGLEPGTTLLTNDIPLDYYSDNSLTAAVNWAYAPNLDSFDVPYMLYFVSVRLGLGLPGLEPDLPIVQHYRPGSFEGSTSDVLVLEYEPPGCLQILDERLHDSMPGLSEGISRAIPLSDLQRIDPSPPVPASSPFGAADVDSWCIRFERAELARQQGKWSEVAEIGDAALAGPDRPNASSEYLPFIESYGHLGRWDDALNWTNVALERNREVRRMICNTWRRLDQGTSASAGKQRAVSEALTLASCEP